MKYENLLIRSERVADYPAVSDVVRIAFAEVPESDHCEHLLVDRLRRSAAFLPDLSLVAELDGNVIAHLMLTRVEIVSPAGSVESLALAPVSVRPAHQRKGVGSALVREAHARAAYLGFRSVVVLGHPGYYARFGYRPAAEFGIRFPFDVPPCYCMVRAVCPDGLADVKGVVRYSEPFMQ